MNQLILILNQSLLLSLKYKIDKYSVGVFAKSSGSKELLSSVCTFKVDDRVIGL